MNHHHHEIPCAIATPRICRAIDLVLRRIADRAPADLERLRTRVSRFIDVPISEDTQGDEVAGAFTNHDFYDFDTPCEVYIAKGRRNYLPVVAHELGHACTREDNFFERDGFDGEWASEMAADFYAYLWVS